MSRRVALSVGAVAAVVIGGGWMAFGSGTFSADKPTFHLDKTRVEAQNHYYDVIPRSET